MRWGASVTPARATLSQSTVSQNSTSAVGKSATSPARRMFWKTPRAAKERCSPRTVPSDEIDAQLDESANALIASDGTVWIIPHLGEQRLLDFSILSGADREAAARYKAVPQRRRFLASRVLLRDIG